MRTSLLIGLCCFLLYNANGRGVSAGDTYPARYLPFAIVQYHTLFLNPVAKVTAQGRAGAFWMLHLPDGHLMSLYPIVTPLLVAPLYIPAVAYLRWSGWSDGGLDYVAKLMEKLSASLIAALSAALLYRLLRRRTTQANALLLTIAYAFGTTTWMTSSQALWQHGVAELLVIAGLLLVTGPVTRPRMLLAGLVCGLLACNRPPDVILGAALGFYALFWWAGARHAVRLALPAALPMLLVLFYNVRYGGNLAGGYGVIGKARFFSNPIVAGIAGLLISPTHGLLVFSPFLIFLVWRPVRAASKPALDVLLLAAVVLQILLYAKVDWRAGLSWGPRYMTDFLPILMWLLVPVVERLGGAGRAVFTTAAGIAIVIEAIGAFTYIPSNDIPIFEIAHGPHMMDAAWQWRNAPFLTSPKQGIAPPDLAVRTKGTFDGVDPTAATGWALAGHKTPARVGVVVDGLASYATATFTDRPDVVATLGERSPSGWRVPIDTSGLSPGEHVLTAMVWPFASGDGQYLGEKTLTLGSTPSAGLADDFRNAAALLNADQRPDGFWLTSFTTGTRFVDPHPEMNTFLTSLLVDLLDPVAAESGLAENVTRARRHLTDQIEPGGLVRYHGLPDAPWIGTLGCKITPDTDDTALVWRIAPATDRRPLASALATIDHYRTPDGLYRSWLAPRSGYQCLDPGRDPNPTDIAIQMHLLLLLAKERPAAAHALCDALRRFIDDDRIWVYYRRTPLVPMLRIGDLHNAGCDLTLPASRMRTEIAGQTIWLDVVRMIASGGDRSRMQAVLRALAQDHFKAVRDNPPLLYHNDLTATVPRYYWSQDAGYALWLRLYRESERQQ
ncbi:MAG TPA: hypothetical protein VH087_02225 [Thermoanaerobaculia bacterium]|nr:hypothetical protein [Thermoanaerobaculia bacterium]